MNTATLNIDIKSYWDAIKNAPSEIKLKLISLLSDSLGNGFYENYHEIKVEENKENLLKKIAGSWDGPESAEELIRLMRENRTYRKQVNL